MIVGENEVRKKDIELFGYTFDGYSGDCYANYQSKIPPKQYCYVKENDVLF